MLAVWGQFIDHDITATALSKGKFSFNIRCIFGMVVIGHAFVEVVVKTSIVQLFKGSAGGFMTLRLVWKCVDNQRSIDLQPE